MGLFVYIIILFFALMHTSPLHADPLLPELQATVDYYDSPEWAAEEAALTAKYDDPEFMDRIFNAEKYERQEYFDWYNKKLFGSDGGPVALHAGDLVFCGSAAAGWAIEWKIYSYLNEALVQLYAEHLTADKPYDQKFYAYKQKTLLPKLISIAIGSTLASMGFLNATKSFYFDRWLDDGALPTSLVNTAGSQIRSTLLTIINPQTWFDIPHGLLDSIGLIPEWTKSNSAEFTKLFITNLLTIIWYERSIIQPAWEKFYQTTDFTNAQICAAIFETEKTKQNAIRKAITPPFLAWLKHKGFTSAIIQTGVNGLLTAYGLWNAYAVLNPQIKEQQ